MTLPENYFYSAQDSITNENKTMSNLTSRLMVEKTKQSPGNEVQRNIAGSSAFSANKSLGVNKQKCKKN